LNNINLLNGLKLVGDYLEKIILKPNNINYPTSRLDFINILKWLEAKKMVLVILNILKFYLRSK
jgi:hypothetical protein